MAPAAALLSGAPPERWCRLGATTIVAFWLRLEKLLLRELMKRCAPSRAFTFSSPLSKYADARLSTCEARACTGTAPSAMRAILPYGNHHHVKAPTLILAFNTSSKIS